MHAVWLVLHAGGAFPDGTQLWSSQRNPGTEVLRIDKVEFPVSTYLAEIRRSLRLHPGIAVYDQEARSVARREALDRLARYARVPGAPILVLGERGTGKTRLIDKSFASLRGRRKVVTLPCGGLDSTLADSLLFGHVKGAFTGAAEERKGLLSEANGGILFLDEVQDLPKPAQRKLVRVFQDRQHLFRQVGADKEIQVDVDLVCASNRTMTELKKDLDPDLYDRLSALIVEIPPLRECREDLPDDWRRVWSELRLDIEMPEQAPWGTPIQDLLSNDPLPGNLRDLQRFGFVLMASWHGRNPADAISRAVVEWHRTAASNESSQPILGNGSRNNQIRAFRAALAVRSKQEFGTWKRAAKALGCDEKTLREDAQVNGG
ncbi:MAG: AAA family ATPase [Verrucomicrobia bacterium]|nr:MAG: AAA family ATPase [Verrucomicrobiota bacterium]